MPYQIEETPKTRQMKHEAFIAFLTGGAGAVVSGLLVIYELLSKNINEKSFLAIAPAILGFGCMVYSRHKLRRAIALETTQIDL